MKVVLTDHALASLEQIVDYMLAEEVPVSRIRQLRDQLLEQAEQLGDNPRLGQAEEYLSHLPDEYRRVVVKKHYKIIYRVEKEAIYVTDIFDSRQDPSKLQG